MGFHTQLWFEIREAGMTPAVGAPAAILEMLDLGEHMLDKCIGPYIETLLFYIMMFPMVGDSVFFFFEMQYLAIRVPGTSLTYKWANTHTHT